MVEKPLEKNNTKPNLFTIIILIIGSIGMLFLTLGCVIDWINKTNAGIDWLVNLLYHPLSGVISIIFFSLLIVFALEKVTPGRLEKGRNYLDDKKNVVRASRVIAPIAFILLIVNSYLLLSFLMASLFGVEVLVLFHILLSILFGISLLISIFKTLISHYMNNPIELQRVLSISVIVILILFTVIVLIGRAMGLLTF